MRPASKTPVFASKEVGDGRRSALQQNAKDEPRAADELRELAKSVGRKGEDLMNEAQRKLSEVERHRDDVKRFSASDASGRTCAAPCKDGKNMFTGSFSRLETCLSSDRSSLDVKATVDLYEFCPKAADLAEAIEKVDVTIPSEQSSRVTRRNRPVDPAWAVGIGFHVLQGPAERPETVEAYVEAFLSDVWIKPLRQLISQSVGGRDHPRRAGLVPTGERRAVLRELLVHPDLWEVTLSRRDKTTGHHESFDVGTRVRFRPYVSVYGHQTLDEDLSRADAWVRVMLDLAEKVGVHHGVVPVMNPSAVATEGAFVAHSHDGVDTHPCPQEFARMNAVERELGTKYLRFPRWGTLYPRAQVEALGGAGKIVDTVKPAVVRELPAALYVQLTDSVATATGAEAAAKQRVFTELVAPLLPPPLA